MTQMYKLPQCAFESLVNSARPVLGVLFTALLPLLRRELCRDRSALGTAAAHLRRAQLDGLFHKFVHSEIY